MSAWVWTAAGLSPWLSHMPMPEQAAALNHARLCPSAAGTEAGCTGEKMSRGKKATILHLKLGMDTNHCKTFFLLYKFTFPH